MNLIENKNLKKKNHLKRWFLLRLLKLQRNISVFSIWVTLTYFLACCSLSICVGYLVAGLLINKTTLFLLRMRSMAPSSLCFHFLHYIVAVTFYIKINRRHSACDDTILHQPHLPQKKLGTSTKTNNRHKQS
jgi:hypothetical protein